MRLFFSLRRLLPTSPLFPYTTLFRSAAESRDRCLKRLAAEQPTQRDGRARAAGAVRHDQGVGHAATAGRSEEHTSELQSHSDLVCRLLLEKKKTETVLTRSAKPTEQV